MSQVLELKLALVSMPTVHLVYLNLLNPVHLTVCKTFVVYFECTWQRHTCFNSYCKDF